MYNVTDKYMVNIYNTYII